MLIGSLHSMLFYTSQGRICPFRCFDYHGRWPFGSLYLLIKKFLYLKHPKHCTNSPSFCAHRILNFIKISDFYYLEIYVQLLLLHAAKNQSADRHLNIFCFYVTLCRCFPDALIHRLPQNCVI